MASVKDATVVWVAKNPQDEKTYVVGWWENATIFNKWKLRPDADDLKKEIDVFSKKNKNQAPHDVGYFITCEEENATLLPAAARNFPIPRGTGGMGSASVWYADGRKEEHADAHRQLKEQVEEYIWGYASLSPQDRGTDLLASNAVETSLGFGEEASSPEGEIRLVTHQVRERNSVLAKKAKATFHSAHGGRLFCEVCQFDFADEYGDLGGNEPYIEAHHVVPLSEGVRETKIEDFMLLCANCHRMAHRLIARCERKITCKKTLKLKDKAYIRKLLA